MIVTGVNTVGWWQRMALRAENCCAPHPSRFAAAHAVEEFLVGDTVLALCRLTNLLRFEE